MTDDPLDTPPADHGSDRHGYVELIGWPDDRATPSETDMATYRCGDCASNLFFRWVGDRPDKPPWSVTVAHDDTCPWNGNYEKQTAGKGTPTLAQANLADAVIAAADLAGRSSGKDFTFGYTRDPDDPDYGRLGPGWYAASKVPRRDGPGLHTIRGEHPTDPTTAADRYAREVLEGGRCTHCGRTTTVDDTPTWTSPTGGPTLGRFGLGARPADNDRCRWWRDGKTWRRACE